jgi:hypothetical protein
VARAAAIELATRIADGCMCVQPDADLHLAGGRAYLPAGFDQVYIGQVGPDADGFFELYSGQVLPRLREEAA